MLLALGPSLARAQAPGSARSQAASASPQIPTRPAAETRPEATQPPPRPSRWLPWTTFGLGVAATLTAAVAFAERERLASRWNSGACLQPGRARGDVCPRERDALESWDGVLLVSGPASLLLFGATILARGLEASPAPASTAGVRCLPGVAGVLCSGRF